jgi:hypothetical protein
MSPYERTLADWAKRPRDHSLAWYEEVHKRQGFVFSTPAFYIMGRPVMKYAPIPHILDVEHVFDFEQCDTWFIFVLTGETRQAWSIMPWELPFMCWSRDNDPTGELRFYETRRLMRLSAPSQ